MMMIVSENSICMLFVNDARRQLRNIFTQFGENIQTARQLHNPVFAKFFENSYSHTCSTALFPGLPEWAGTRR